MGTEINVNTVNMTLMKEDRNSPEYLSQLLKDKKQIQAFPNVFIHMERLLDEEINKVRGQLFHLSSGRQPLDLPDQNGAVITLSEKLFVPVKEHPEFNFVGRILGPRGMTAKQLEQDTGCKIMVRGKGSMRDKKKEELNRGKPNWEHLNEELHVLITVEDTRNRCEVKIKRAVDEVKKLLVPAPEGEDELKKMQLMELAIINGTYREGQKAAMNAVTIAHEFHGVPNYYSKLPRMLAPHHMQLPPGMRSPTPQGAPLMLAPRIPTSIANSVAHAALMNGGGPPPLVSHAELSGMYPYDPYGLAASMGSISPTLLEYPGLDHSGAGAVSKVRRAVGVREHPYTRVSLA